MIRFVMIGGFLGAGKTTTIARLASAYTDQGKNVGIVTNDQASDLVDTISLRSQGFDVGEVAGACFCCNFNDLTDTIGKLKQSQQPDIIIAEPVGSCTDLVATVIQPMVHIHQGQFEIAPYGVILKPSHGQKILSGKSNVGFSPKAAYIFEKQLEEADFAIINHIDKLSNEKVDELISLMKSRYPGTPLVKMSAKTGDGFSELLSTLEQQGEFGKKILDLDYDIYAEGEAELGWLNSSVKLTAAESVSLDTVTLALLKSIQEQIASTSAEIAHLKILAVSDGAHAVANLTNNEDEAALSLTSDCITRTADIVVNARVATDPTKIDELVSQALVQVGSDLNVSLQTVNSQHFRPGRPVPTHRFS